MTTSNQNQALNLAAANNAAQQNFPAEDLNCSVGACPARQAEVFIVPTRYALAEQPAEHTCLQPDTTPQSHPMALRRLRTGYLYLWHHEGPLRRYAVAADGLLTEQALDDEDSQPMQGQAAGIALNKQYDAWLLYSEIPLPAEARKRLTDVPGERRARMRHIALTQVAHSLKATHCPPFDNADQVLAELLPEVREKALAHDHTRNGAAHREGVDALGQRMMENPSSENVQTYVNARIWLAERERASARHPEAAQHGPGEWSAVAWDIPATDAWLNRARREGAELHAVFVALDDDLGVLRDLNHEQERLEAGHENWIADNNLRQSVGGFIRSLIREDGGEVANLLNYRYRDRDIQLTPDQGETILASQRRLDELFKEESRINQERGRRYSHTQADAELARVHAEVAATTAPVRGFIPIELHGEVEYVVREYRKEKVANLAGGRANAQVAEHIDLERMDAWLDQEAPAHYRQVEQRHQALYADRDRFLPRHASGTWFVDYDDPAHQRWLDELADACLSAQCSRQQGADQFADYVRSDDPGSLRLVFHAWSPSLEAAVNSSNRLNELAAALSLDNLADTRAALGKTLDEAALRALERLADDVEGYWAGAISRLGAALLAGKTQAGLASQWMGLLLVARFGQDSRLVRGLENGVEVWRLLGEKADALQQWTRNTAQAIRSGNAAGVLQSPAVQNSGGLLPLAALLLNALNASNYASQADLLEGEGAQRRAEHLSATLFAAAALTAVVQNWMIIGKGIEEIGRNATIAPTLTLFGGIVGLLSFGAAGAELISLQKQIENTQSRVDPWLDIRRLAVTGQVAVYGAQTLLGLGLTGMRLANRIDTPTAIRRFRLGMGPLNLLLLGLGGLYLYAWSRQSTPLQNYLAGCCWSRGRAYKRESLAAEQQVAEFEQLLALLYKPRLGLRTESVRIAGTLGDTVTQDGIAALTVDLPGADPDSVQLELALSGNPTPASVRIFGEGTRGTPTDLGATWLGDSRCTWIPAGEGQGLRLSGSFARPLTRASLRLRYHSPVALLAGLENVIGGPRGLAYTLGPSGLLTDGEVIELRADDPTPELDRVTPHRLDGTEYLQPKDSA
ncbi:hypothetical protein SAMN05216601_101190 [Ectopseudomonas composti]|uniref:Toxin VasX N-terminal region domain-containing protein n=2 Tax=Gammaproteobacteria TaxID=1236 RepID=A0A1I5JAM7_9GAMM|nr:toxin VasX [Pseudomonas composti]SFO69914.1 hypothetical protein SAMN05216601_101190 [Pseudomonas composti]